MINFIKTFFSSNQINFEGDTKKGGVKNLINFFQQKVSESKENFKLPNKSSTKPNNKNQTTEPKKTTKTEKLDNKLQNVLEKIGENIVTQINKLEPQKVQEINEDKSQKAISKPAISKNSEYETLKIVNKFELKKAQEVKEPKFQKVTFKPEIITNPKYEILETIKQEEQINNESKTAFDEISNQRLTIAQAQKASVNILGDDGLGSGIIIDKENGYIITNKHVIQDLNTKKENTNLKLQFNGINDEIKTNIVHISDKYDLAIVKFDPKDLSKNLNDIGEIKIEANKPQTNDSVIAIGNSHALGVKESHKYGVSQKALIRKNNDGTYSDLYKKEVLVKTFLEKTDDGKYKDENGLKIIRKNNEYYYEKNNEKIDDRNNVIIHDNNKNQFQDYKGNYIKVMENNNRKFIDGKRIIDSTNLSEWKDAPYSGQYFVDISQPDAFLDLKQNDLKNIQGNFYHNDKGEKILINDGYIDNKNSRYFIGNFNSNSQSAAIGEITHNNTKVPSLTGSNEFIKSELMTYPGNSGGMLINKDGNLVGINSGGRHDNEYKEGSTITSSSIPTSYVMETIKEANKEKGLNIKYQVVDHQNDKDIRNTSEKPMGRRQSFVDELQDQRKINNNEEITRF